MQFSKACILMLGIVWLCAMPAHAEQQPPTLPFGLSELLPPELAQSLSHAWSPDTAEKNLRQLEKLTDGILTIHDENDKITVTFDKDAYRRKEKEIRQKIGQYIRDHHPEEADAVQHQYGLRIYQQDQKSRFLPVHEELPADLNLADTDVVILVHGLDDPGGLWDQTIPVLQEKGFLPIEVTYPNDQAIQNSSELVADMFQQLRTMDCQQLAIVAHSMGGLVCRNLLTHDDLYPSDLSAKIYPQVTQLIMVGTPNHGSEMARLRIFSELRDQLTRVWHKEDLSLGALLDGAGEAGVDLLPGSPFLKELNARANPERIILRIIAGRISNADTTVLQNAIRALPWESESAADKVGKSMQSLANGIGDGCVTIESASLQGAASMDIVQADHIGMLRSFSLKSQDASADDPYPPAIPLIVKYLKPAE